MESLTLLPDVSVVDSKIQSRVREDYERYARGDWPHPIEDFLRDRYRLDVAAEYAGLPIKNLWGKASGQLSMTESQVGEDVAAGLGFVVLKTVIAEDESGSRSMAAWAIPESRMLVEPIAGQSGEKGWTVTWKGRGWSQSFDDYLALVRKSRELARDRGTLIVPSCKYHLPAQPGASWRVAEYETTTRRILDAWSSGGAGEPMPIEKDFSPTLAGSDWLAIARLFFSG